MYQQRSKLDWPLARMMPAAWAMATIWWLSDKSTLYKPERISGLIWSTMGHFIMFGLLGLGIWWALGMNSRLLDRERTWLAIGIATLFGVLDEYHQSFVPGRTPDFKDMITDFLGAAVFVIVVPKLYKRF